MSEPTTPALEIGGRLVALCQEGKSEEAARELYSQGIVSIEGPGGDPSMQRLEGLEAVLGKGAWWEDNHEVHKMEATGPFCGHRADQFAVKFDLDVTFKPTGERTQMSEMALYTVEDGKIAQEEFLYLAG